MAVFNLVLALVMVAFAPGRHAHTGDMLAYIARENVGVWGEWAVRIVGGLPLLSASNTAVNGLISIIYVMSRDGCVHCLSQCQVCSRRLRGHWRHGFAGAPARTVCAACHQRLLLRQMVQDRQAASNQELARHQAALAHELARHRLFQQDQALRLDRERTYLTAQIQAARYGLKLRPAPPLKRVMKAVGNVLRTVVKHARRGLRGHPSAGGATG